MSISIYHEPEAVTKAIRDNRVAFSLLAGKELFSDLDLAIESVRAIYAAYLSVEKGIRFELDTILTCARTFSAGFSGKTAAGRGGPARWS
jgi:hypothetical protein